MILRAHAIVKPNTVMIKVNDALVAGSTVLCAGTDPCVTHLAMKFILFSDIIFINLKQFCSFWHTHIRNFFLNCFANFYLFPNIDHWVSWVNTLAFYHEKTDNYHTDADKAAGSDNGFYYFFSFTDGNYIQYKLSN